MSYEWLIIYDKIGCPNDGEIPESFLAIMGEARPTSRGGWMWPCPDREIAEKAISVHLSKQYWEWAYQDYTDTELRALALLWETMQLDKALRISGIDPRLYNLWSPETQNRLRSHSKLNILGGSGKNPYEPCANRAERSNVGKT